MYVLIIIIIIIMVIMIIITTYIYIYICHFTGGELTVSAILRKSSAKLRRKNIRILARETPYMCAFVCVRVCL